MLSLQPFCDQSKASLPAVISRFHLRLRPEFQLGVDDLRIWTGVRQRLVLSLVSLWGPLMFLQAKQRRRLELLGRRYLVNRVPRRPEKRLAEAYPSEEES